MVWYEQDVQGVIEHRDSLLYNPATVFYGSSTIRLWDSLYNDFEKFKPVNLGFGGSTLAACTWFFDDIIAPITGIKKFVLYAGDNDLGDERHPEEVYIFYKQFITLFRKQFKKVPLYYISIKPSIQRFEILDKIIRTNKLIEDDINKSGGNEIYVNIFDKMITKKATPVKKYFDADGLHLSKKGYSLWKEVILEECLNY